MTLSGPTEVVVADYVTQNCVKTDSDLSCEL